MILRIRDIHALAREVVVDDGKLVFARLISGSQEARAIAYFVAQKGGYADAHPYVSWVQIQAATTQVHVDSTWVQGVAQKIITLYLPAVSSRFYFIAWQAAVERQFHRFLQASTPYPIPHHLPPPEHWGERLETYEAQGLVALAFRDIDIQELLKEASHAP
jgi:hypothetical protein